MSDPLRKLVFNNLNSAIENDYTEILDWSDADVAHDLTAWAADLEEYAPEELLPHVAAWKAERKQTT